MTPGAPHRAAAALLRAATDNVVVRAFPGAVLVFDQHLRFVGVGGAADLQTGPFSAAGLIGRTLSDACAPDLVATAEPVYRAALQGTQGSLDARSDGRIYEQRVGPLRDDAGAVIGGMALTVDVTDARRLAREAREAELPYRLAFSDGPVPMAVIQLDGTYQRVNAALCRLLELSEGQLLGRSGTDFAHPDDHGRDLANLAALRSGELSTVTDDKRYLTGTGRTIWVSRTATLARREDGTPASLVVQLLEITGNKLHREELAKERERLAEAEAVGRVGLWEMDVATTALTWSAGTFAIWGVDRADFAGDHAAALAGLHRDDVAAVDAAVQACGRVGTPVNVRARVLRADDGRVSWIEIRGTARRQGDRIVQILGAVLDVTEQVSAELELRSAQAFQQAIFTASPDTISVWDLGARSIRWTNRPVHESLGYDEKDLAQMGGRVESVILDADRAQARAAVEPHRYPADDTVVEVDFRVARKDGSIRWFSQRTAPLLRDADGQVSQLVAVLRDTTQAKAVEASLQESQALFDQLANSVEVAFIVRAVDPPAFLYVSPAYEKIFGYDPMATGERPQESLRHVHPDDWDRFLQEYWAPSRAGIPTQLDYRVVAADGVERWVRAKSRPVVDPATALHRTASTVEDITAARQAEAALLAAAAAERANIAKNDFLSRMSHELRTPLNAVLGFAQLLQLDPLSADQAAAVGHILRGGRHLLGLIDDVLDISKIESDRLEMSLELVPVSVLLNETVELMTPQATAAGVSMTYRSSVSAAQSVRADHRRLRQVMLNLLSNAIKYNRPGGRVEVSCSRAAGANLEITVQDTGRGIREEDLPRLFTPFDRLGAQATGIEGTGVGLALSHRLMTLMGGTLTARSRVGMGSVFVAAIPLTDTTWVEPEVPEVDLVVPESSRPRRTLLYVEDNSSNIELMERLVTRRADWDMVVAGHGALGVELAESIAPDLILLDLHLPDMNGMDILLRLRVGAHAATPVVVISADANPHQVDRVLAAGAHAYLTKPLEVAKVLQLLDSL